MCFCLRRANRLLPNQLSFQLQPTNQARGYDRTDEEQGDPESRRGLLSEQEDEDDYDEEEAGWASRRQQHASQRYQDDDEDDNESFGDMQDATTPTNHDTDAPRTPLFNIADDDDDDDGDNDNSRSSSNHNDNKQQKRWFITTEHVEWGGMDHWLEYKDHQQ